MKKKLLYLAGIALILSFSETLSAQTVGTLTFSFTPVSHTGYSGTKNVLAVWIQTNTGVFIKTKLRYVGGGTDDHLPIWGANSGCANSTAVTATTGCNTTDGISGATLTNFTAKSITWDGKNVVGTLNGTTVVDGVYKVTIEETWNHGTTGTTTRSFTFTKGTSADTQSPAADTNFTNISLSWTPTALGISDVKYKEPAVVIYPVPSSGVFNIDLKNEIKNIKVYNLLGQTVYSKTLKNNNAETTEQIDLSNLSNGNYVISLSNENGVSNYEVILKK